MYLAKPDVLVCPLSSCSLPSAPGRAPGRRHLRSRLRRLAGPHHTPDIVRGPDAEHLHLAGDRVDASSATSTPNIGLPGPARSSTGSSPVGVSSKLAEPTGTTPRLFDVCTASPIADRWFVFSAQISPLPVRMTSTSTSTSRHQLRPVRRTVCRASEPTAFR